MEYYRNTCIDSKRTLIHLSFCYSNAIVYFFFFLFPCLPVENRANRISPPCPSVLSCCLCLRQCSVSFLVLFLFHCSFPIFFWSAHFPSAFWFPCQSHSWCVIPIHLQHMPNPLPSPTSYYFTYCLDICPLSDFFTLKLHVDAIMYSQIYPTLSSPFLSAACHHPRPAQPAGAPHQ